jgi:hypothetical protein
MQKSSPIVNLCIDITENNIIIYIGIGNRDMNDLCL